MRTVYGAMMSALLLAGAAAWCGPAAAETVMQQCGQQYQAAKAANTLNGQTWNQFRTACAERLKATPAAATTTAPATPPAAANPLKPAPAAVPATTAAAPAAVPAPAATTAAAPAPGSKPMSAGRTAFVARERQCGAEWKANKATLVAATPGLKWPQYLSACNKRLKAAGQ